MSLRLVRVCALSGVIAIAFGATGCSRDQQQRDEKTREDAAKAAERAKPALQEAGREIGKAAHTAADEAAAAAQGVREGWNRSGHALDINSASEDELAGLPGITRHDARKIIANRPYRDPHELVTRGIVSDDEYSRIHDGITAK